jgi:2-octaprenyl-6-methoxyphenol hydroxylase
MMKSYDLIIVGGGLVGAGLARALSDLDLSIALVDAKLPSATDPRLFALNKSSCQLLQNLGVWPHLAKHAAPIHQVHVSHQGRFGSVRLRREEVDAVSLGHVIPAYLIESALNDALLTLDNVTLYRPATLTTLTQTNGVATLTLAQDDQCIHLQSGIVIGADGAESIVREQANIATELFDYEQCAIVTRTSLQRSHHHIAYERFLSEGAIAMLPLAETSQHECATIWTTGVTFAEKLMAMSEAEFLNALQHDFGYRLGRLQATSKRHVFPLRMLRAKKAVEQSVLLLGNALHTLHPIAAQGFNLALYEVAALVEGIKAARTKQELISANTLQAMIERTQQQQSASIGVSHRLPQFFSQQSFLMSFISQLGMVGLDIALPLKRKFINSMMGRAGSVPRLLMDVNEA